MRATARVCSLAILPTRPIPKRACTAIRRWPKRKKASWRCV